MSLLVTFHIHRTAARLKSSLIGLWESFGMSNRLSVLVVLRFKTKVQYVEKLDSQSLSLPMSLS